VVHKPKILLLFSLNIFFFASSGMLALLTFAISSAESKKGKSVRGKVFMAERWKNLGGGWI
jgi:hypothetical protein